MSSKPIVNAKSAFGQTSGAQGGPYSAYPMYNSSTTVTINAGDLVVFDATTAADVLPSVQQAGAGSSVYMIAGIAKDTIAPLKTGNVVTQGYALANCTGTTPATAGLFKGGAAAGAMVLVAAPADTDIVGAHVGVTLGTKTGNLVPVWVDRV
jgi:hypothetical protein